MNDILELIKKAAKEAGQITGEYFNQELEPNFKTSHQDLVTKADLDSQQKIQQIITEGMYSLEYQDEVGFVGEENLNVSSKKHLFVIDPIDGTTNFSSGLGYYCISIGYLYQGEVLLGVVHYPKEDTLFVAEKGKGAQKIVKGKIMELKTTEKALNEVILAAHFNSDLEIRNKMFKIYSDLYPKLRGFRAAGSITLDLCHLTSNIFGLVVNGQCFIWDIAAAFLIIKESGGVLVNWQGKEIELDLGDVGKNYQLIACHPKLLAEVLPSF